MNDKEINALFRKTSSKPMCYVTNPNKYRKPLRRKIKFKK